MFVVLKFCMFIFFLTGLGCAAYSVVCLFTPDDRAKSFPKTASMSYQITKLSFTCKPNATPNQKAGYAEPN